MGRSGELSECANNSRSVAIIRNQREGRTCHRGDNMALLMDGKLEDSIASGRVGECGRTHQLLRRGTN